MSKTARKQIDFPAFTPNQLGSVLRGYRRELGLSQRGAAAAGGLLQKTVSKLETDPSSASIETLFRLLSALNIELVVRRRGANARPDAEW